MTDEHLDDAVVDELNNRIHDEFHSEGVSPDGITVQIPSIVINILRDPHELPKPQPRRQWEPDGARVTLAAGNVKDAADPTAPVVDPKPGMRVTARYEVKGVFQGRIRRKNLDGTSIYR